MYSINKGKLNKKNPGLLSVNVTLNTPDEEAAKADLKNKLTSVYGPCASDNFFGTVWLGSDDTCVVLYDLTGVSIMYAKTDNVEVVSQMYTDLGLNADELDTSGL